MANLIGTDPNQVPTNGDLGTMAFQDNDGVKVTDLTATTVQATTVETTNNFVKQETLGQLGSINDIRYYAKGLKRATNSTDIEFTLSCSSQANIWRHGFIRLTVSGGASGDSNANVAEFLFSVRASQTEDYPIGLNERASTGNTGAFTVTLNNGVLNIAHAENNVIAVCEYTHYTGDVSIA
jgi:hypothetical protein